jgi:hypothetical protein
VDVEGRDRARPRDALLVGVLLDGGGGEPGGPLRWANSSSLAGRNGAPSALVSLMSLIWWSPRTTTSTSPRPFTITGKDFSSAPAGRPSLSATSAIVVRPGVGTSSGAFSGAGSSTGTASALATSTLAA